ncbi:MAG: ATP-binding protein [Lachnospiraceae bacterium]|nr:ATP-binding protein [Lachnospiraceae bacterium]
MIGRKEEIHMLDNALSSGRPEFVAIYGRRRVGKTYLIKEYFNNTFSFYATGVQNTNTKQQLRLFYEALKKNGDQSSSIPKDWFEAFSRLEKLLSAESVTREYKSNRRVIFLDEIPWMDTAKSGFKSALEYFWNSWGSSQKDLMLIVCGSATSWIINNIAKDTGGFYNRLTRQIHLLPFTLEESEELLISNGIQMTRKQIIECYMVFGGIPYYLNYISPGNSPAQIVEMLFFKENSPLKNEFRQLFSSLYKNSDKYISIIKELAKTKSGITRADITASKKTVTGKDLTQCLESLEQCGFIRKYHDFTRAVNGCFYQLIDPLCLFHLTFIESGKTGSWLDMIGTPGYNTWCGLAFEKVCLQHIPQIKRALGISGVYTQAFSWKSKKTTPGAQIDLLIDRKDDVINICEIKYSKEEYAIDANYEKKLIHKIETLRAESHTSKSLWLTMITLSGLKKNEYSGSVQAELTADDLFGW